MNYSLGLNQDVRLSQQLNLAPQLLNWLKLLQCPTTDLSQLIQHELDCNPALETAEGDGEDPAAPELEPGDACDPPGSDAEPEPATDTLKEQLEYLSAIEDDWRDDYLREQARNSASRKELGERQDFLVNSIAAQTGLYEHLVRQVATLPLSASEMQLAELAIGSLDDRGYLTVSIEELAEAAASSRADAERVLAWVQSLDPSGIGARSLGECLLLQLQQHHPDDALAALLVRDFLTEVAERRTDALLDLLGVSADALAGAVETISRLDPCPGSVLASRAAPTVTPDIRIREVNSEYQVELSDEHLPRLRISAACRRMLAEKILSRDDRQYVRGKIRAATFLIQGISQRQETLRKVALQIIRIQKEFFSSEDGPLRPLTMAKVAAVIGVHETTISRALANKYVETPRGLYEMKYFFRSGYQCRDGTSITPDTVKEQMVRLINREDPGRPLTDLDIVNHFAAQGLHLARRTIAKYRDELKISASKDRKAGTLSRLDIPPIRALKLDLPRTGPLPRSADRRPALLEALTA